MYNIQQIKSTEQDSESDAKIMKVYVTYQFIKYLGPNRNYASQLAFI
jgi:hypothetical protein